MKEYDKYLKLLKEKYPTKQSVYRELINLNAIMNLPKGTEHFMSDLHGEYDAFYHIINNCSGVIREKVAMLYGDELTIYEQQELCTLIYYPREKLSVLMDENKVNDEWYRNVLNQLIQIAKLLSSKYTRSKVRKAMPVDFAYIIDELIHAQKDEDDNRSVYHRQIMETILSLHNGDEFLVALTDLIKRLAVDHLHILGDIYDRGPHADKILDLLMEHHSVDIQWGNHDILWMGAFCGNPVCMALVVRNNIKYKTMSILENGYGISLRFLLQFAVNTYSDKNVDDAVYKAISVILFKLEGQLIKRHPEYRMEGRLLLDKMNLDRGTVRIGDKDYFLNTNEFPTVDMNNPYELTMEEMFLMGRFRADFINSMALEKHNNFLYEKGSIYKIHNGNLLFHGCVPLDEQGVFDGIVVDCKSYSGREYLDYCESMVRQARTGDSDAVDFMWFLWSNILSPVTGRCIKTFERTFLDKDRNADYKKAIEEDKNPYYVQYENERICKMILREFNLYNENAHIINGHTPVRTKEGQHPVRAGGKLIVIDGGFCEGYHAATGIAGYTLIYNSHGMKIKEHHPFMSINMAINSNRDIESESQVVYVEKQRVFVKDTDNGKQIAEEINDLMNLLKVYNS